MTPRVTTKFPVLSFAKFAVVGCSEPPTSLANCSRFFFVVSSSMGEKPVPATVLPAELASPPSAHELGSRQVRMDVSPNTVTTAAAASSELLYRWHAVPLQLEAPTIPLLVTGKLFIML